MNQIAGNGLKVEKSRFASLKIENDDDEDDQKKNQQKNDNWQKVSNKKKGGAANAKPNEQKNGKNGKNGNSNAKPNGQSAKVKPQPGQDDWQVWKEKDEQFADNLFKEQMKQALIESKLDFECNKSASKKVEPKKPNNKPVKMSLEEFHRKLDQPSHAQNTVQGPNENTETEKFIDKIDQQLNDLLLRETRTHSTDKDASMEKFLCLQYQDQLEKKNAQIEQLTSTVNSLKEEISQVKLRNKQLAFIISQGELKEKSELVNETIELNNVKNELTQQISELIKSLEQEKSKVHQLENELKKTTKSKH